MFLIGKFFGKSQTRDSDITRFYSKYGLNVEEVHAYLKEEIQKSNLAKINTLISQWQKIFDKTFSQKPTDLHDSLYSYELNEDIFRDSFERLVLFCLYLNELGATNRAKIVISTLQDLLEDYSYLVKNWKGARAGIITGTPLSLGGKTVIAQLEVAWALKIIFAICPEGDNPLSIIRYFSQMTLAFLKNDPVKMACAAEKLSIQKLNVKFIAENFYVMAAIVAVNIEKGFLQTDDLT